MAPADRPLTAASRPDPDPRPSTLATAWDALGQVVDPELGLDVVTLGLVYDLRQEGDRVVVDMTLTTPGCPAAGSLPEVAAATVHEALGSGVEVDVRLVWDPPWTPARMTAEALSALGLRRRRVP